MMSVKYHIMSQLKYVQIRAKNFTSASLMPGGMGTVCLYWADGNVFCAGGNKNVCSSFPSHNLW